MVLHDTETYKVTAQLVAIAFDSIAPNSLARFWAHALRWSMRDAVGVGVELVPPKGTSFQVLFQQVADAKVGQNRIHFDLTTTSLDDRNDTVAELLAIGATHVDIGQDPNGTHVVLADPESNELCIIEPYNRFLASCPRLGAVNCDGTRALGCFWSEAFGWPLIWDQDEETAIQAPGGTGPNLTWSGPPLMPKLGKDRLHFHVAPSPGTGTEAALDHLVALGASRLDAGRACPGAIALADSTATNSASPSRRAPGSSLSRSSRPSPERSAGERSVRHQRGGPPIRVGHRTLRIVGKGNKPATIPRVHRTARTIDLSSSPSSPEADTVDFRSTVMPCGDPLVCPAPRCRQR